MRSVIKFVKLFLLFVRNDAPLRFAFGLARVMAWGR